ncbi:MAG: sarcosine oxidase subunit gamma family protein [Pseudomonadota bacterium]
MLEPQQALGGAVCEGPVRVTELPVLGMITVRGDLSTDAIRSAMAGEVPGARQIVPQGDRALAWMSPDELLLILPYKDVPATLENLNGTLQNQHALVVDVSDARTVFEISGPGAREILAKLCPVDLHPDQFGPGEMRRTRAAQVPVAFWMERENMFRLICFRSVSRYVFDILAGAAHPAARLDIFAPSNST